MPQDILVSIVGDCCSKVMELADVQLAVCKVANYLIKKESSQKEVNKDQTKFFEDQSLRIVKEAMDKEIARVDEKFMKQGNQLEKTSNKLWKLNHDLDEIKVKIKQLNEVCLVQCRNEQNGNDKKGYQVSFNKDFQKKVDNFMSVQLEVLKQKQLVKKREHKYGVYEKYGLQKRIISSYDWVNHDSYYFDQFKFKNNKIISTTQHNIYGFDALGGQFAYSFEIYENSKHIQFGISNVENIIQIKRIYQRILLTLQGKFFINDVKDVKQSEKSEVICDGIKKKRIIEMIGNVRQSQIKYKINGVEVLSVVVQEMKNKKIVWVPFMYFSPNMIVSINYSYPQLELFPFSLVEGMFEWDYDILYDVYQFIKEGDYQNEGMMKIGCGENMKNENILQAELQDQCKVN